MAVVVGGAGLVVRVGLRLMGVRFREEVAGGLWLGWSWEWWWEYVDEELF